MKIQRIKNEMIQYGFTPLKIKSRFNCNSLPIVLGNSIPKSGTNLLLRSLYMMPYLYRKFTRTIDSVNEKHAIEVLCKSKKGQIIASHLKYTARLSAILETYDIKHIFIVRDPRDIAVSNFIYITYKDKSHRLHNYFANKLRDDNTRLYASINGISKDLLDDNLHSLSLADHISAYLPWYNNKSVLIIKFEELIGQKGGGSRSSQINAINKICDFIGIDMNIKKIAQLADNLYNPNSRTFVKGKIGAWKIYFNKDHIRLFKKILGKILIEMGYEKNEVW